jgi:polyphenol oxidase
MRQPGDIALKFVDELLAEVGLAHGRRNLPGWVRSRAPRGGGDRTPRDHAAGRSRKPALPGKVDVVRVPEWEELDWLCHGFSTRTGGGTVVYRPEPVGSAGRGELNLGFTVWDRAATVAANRERFVEAVFGVKAGRGRRRDAPLSTLVTLKQIHSSLIRRVKAEGFPSGKPLLSGDGLLTDDSGTLLGIQTADCIPVLIADRKKRAVAAFHAGWRGTLKRIVENGVGRMRVEFGSHPRDLVAAIGPGIGQCCYAVGEEIRGEFESQFRYAPELFCEVYDSDPVREKYPLLFLTARAPGHSSIGPSLHLDLMEANRRQLLDAGLRERAVHVVGECTSCRTDRYFSHRAEQGFTGRMLSVIGVRGDKK